MMLIPAPVDRKTSHHQRGISLVIVMIFLVILSVLGISAMQSSTLSSRIARNEIDRGLAFQAAEAALRDGELDVRNERFDRSKCDPLIIGCRSKKIDRASRSDLACTAGLCAHKDGVAPWETSSRWVGAGASVPYGTYTGAKALPLVASPPRYLIEALPQPFATYRITALGVGANASTQVMLQIVVVAQSQL